MLKYLMNISEVYKKYMTPKNLQEHMLRVAALSKIVGDNWTGSTNDRKHILKWEMENQQKNLKWRKDFKPPPPCPAIIHSFFISPLEI